MADGKTYQPGNADLAILEKHDDDWKLVPVKDLRHRPEKVWRALTQPEHLREWAPFDASRDLGAVGTVELTWTGAPRSIEARVTRADPPTLLEYEAGAQTMRWQLEERSGGTRLTLWAVIDRPYIAMGAAGWHIAFDVLERLLDGPAIGRIAGKDAMQFDGWQRLHAEYAKQFDADAPNPNAHEQGMPT